MEVNYLFSQDTKQYVNNVSGIGFVLVMKDCVRYSLQNEYTKPLRLFTHHSSLIQFNWLSIEINMIPI